MVRLRDASKEPAIASASEPLLIAHLNHQLRGAESDADEEFVRQLYEMLVASGAPGLQFHSERIDVAGRASDEGGNLEGVARRLRYEWLGTVALQNGCPFVATGHTANDQAETVLHRLI